jgi:(2Fe-2S) ferredoxin
VAKLKSPGELDALRSSIIKKRDPARPVITVCNGTGCQAYGSRSVAAAFFDEVKKQKLESKVDVKTIGCPGFCERGTLVVVKPKDIFYQRVRPKDVPEIISEVGKGGVVNRLLYTDRVTNEKVVKENDVPISIRCA